LNHGQAQTPAVGDLQQSKVCSTASSRSNIGGSGGFVVGASTITMSNDGGWCWLSLWANQGSMRYVPTFRVAQPPAHGQLVMGEVSNRARVAYRPAAGFAGEDRYRIIDTLNNAERAVTITVSQ
jgi:hypothetical protein